MGSLYQENKIFVNRFKKALESGMFKCKDIGTSVSVYFGNTPSNLNIHSVLNIVSKPYEVVVEEVSKKLYFGVRVKEVDRLLRVNSLNQDAFLEMAAEIYSDSLSNYYTPQEEKDAIFKYLKSKNILTLQDKKTDINDSNLLNRVRNLAVNHPEELKDYGIVKTIESDLRNLKSAPIRIYLHPDVFKTIKSREMIPLVYIDGVKRTLNYIAKSSNNRTSMSMFEHISTQVLNSSDIKPIVSRSYRYCPFSSWVVYDIDSNVIDRKMYMGYNYDL